MNFIFHSHKPWISRKIDEFEIHTAGFVDRIDELLEILKVPEIKISDLENFLLSQNWQFGLIIQKNNLLFATTDRTRSFPLFYNTLTNKASNHAPSLSSDLEHNIHQQALLEFTAAGYTIGRKTLHTNIETFLAGEYILNSLPLKTYYTYKPDPRPISYEDALKKFDDVLNQSITSCIEKLSGAPLLLPLSGGLDSRLLLSKFHEHGYKNIKCFSYGLKNNGEARVAQKIAKTIGVEWHMLSAQPDKARTLFYSDERKHYESLVHNYHAVPSYVEYEAIHALRTSALATPESFIINGQTGDFISGGHIPAALYESTEPLKKDMIDYIIAKHFSMWENLKTPENIRKLETSIKQNIHEDISTLIGQYESFEWQERQCKMVVNAAHIYDFFGFHWMLPLWHSSIIDFFETLPFDFKYKQKLYIDYLLRYNYMGVFDIPRATIKTWALHQSWIILAGKMIEFTQDHAAKTDFYKKMSYYGHAHNQYALFGRDLYNTHYKYIRNMISLSILDFCKNHKLPFLPK